MKRKDKDRLRLTELRDDIKRDIHHVVSVSFGLHHDIGSDREADLVARLKERVDQEFKSRLGML